MVMLLAEFNELPSGEAEKELLSCCASPVWAARVAAGRPYADLPALVARAEAALPELDWAQVRLALDAHPRIGERAAGVSRESAWSRREQSGAAQVDVSTAAALVRANLDYEERFGHVFLIFATGRSAEQMLQAAHDRLDHDPQTEQQVVRGELAAITGLRLSRLIST